MSSICEWQARSGKLVALGPKLGFREICLFGTEQCLEKPKIFTKKKKKVSVSLESNHRGSISDGSSHFASTLGGPQTSPHTGPSGPLYSAAASVRSLDTSKFGIPGMDTTESRWCSEQVRSVVIRKMSQKNTKPWLEMEEK